MQYIVEAENLKKTFDGLVAVDDISFHVMPGECFGILGPNGAGKSTMLQAIAGMLVPGQGAISFEERPIQGLPAYKVAALGLALVPEGGWLFGQMSAEENLLMGAYPKMARQNIKRHMDVVFDLFPILAERRKQQEETLSGGERQMLAVGRGLMSNPKMLLLDEPSLGLAPLVVKDILSALVRINQEEKTTILLTEQNIFHALKISQRGYLLENGRFAMQGASKELLGNEHIKKNYLGL